MRVYTFSYGGVVFKDMPCKELSHAMREIITKIIGVGQLEFYPQTTALGGFAYRYAVIKDKHWVGTVESE